MRPAGCPGLAGFQVGGTGSGWPCSRVSGVERCRHSQWRVRRQGSVSRGGGQPGPGVELVAVPVTWPARCSVVGSAAQAASVRAVRLSTTDLRTTDYGLRTPKASGTSSSTARLAASSVGRAACLPRSTLTERWIRSAPYRHVCATSPGRWSPRPSCLQGRATVRPAVLPESERCLRPACRRSFPGAWHPSR